jgi:hypothetical protein
MRRYDNFIDSGQAGRGDPDDWRPRAPTCKHEATGGLCKDGKTTADGPYQIQHERSTADLQRAVIYQQVEDDALEESAARSASDNILG